MADLRKILCHRAGKMVFIFFEYCMKQNEKNVYFILDRKSPQWNDMQKYSQNVIPFLSFRHILYLLTADLYILRTDVTMPISGNRCRTLSQERSINKNFIFFSTEYCTFKSR